MLIDLEIAGQLIIVAGFICGCFKYIVINPLQHAIEALGNGVECLNRNLERLQDQQHDLEKRVVALEQSVKSAHHRIDTLEELIRK